MVCGVVDDVPEREDQSLQLVQPGESSSRPRTWRYLGGICSIARISDYGVTQLENNRNNRLATSEHEHASEHLGGALIRMHSDSPGTLAQILKTTLYLVEKRKDLDQQSPSVSRLKESMRRTIDELEKKVLRDGIGEAGPQSRQSHWTDAFRKK